MDDRMRILLCEDDENLGMLLREYLQAKGFNADLYADGESGYKAFLKGKYDICVLDVMMPKKDGFSVAQDIRTVNSEVPIIFLTAKQLKEDILEGFKIGADDYITKPFNPLEVVARVKTQLRRYTRYNLSASGQSVEGNEYDIRGLWINRDNHKCLLYDKELSLTPIEFSLLWYLCEHQGMVVSSEELFEAVWGEKYLGQNNTVMTHVGRLREKMNEPARNPRFIKTVWGVGYIIEK